MSRTRAITFALFFLSGVSGLVYQVVWVRQFGHAFGNTVHSAALVTSVFMCGLGAGSYFVGRWSDRRRHGQRALLTWYGYSEVAIALLGLALAVVVPRLAPLSAAISSYQQGAGGWYELSAMSWLFRYVIAIVILAPSCFIMGGTLTLLIRAVVASDLASAAWRIGLLYGLNTAGAALGAIATDFWLIPRGGIFDTQLLAVVFNLVAGLGALGCAKSLASSRASSLTMEAASAEPSSAETVRPRGLAYAGAALGMLGFAAMGLEILWFRFLSQLLGSMRSVFSLLLGTLLVGMWLGSFCAGYLHRRYGRPRLWFIATQAALVLVTLASLMLVDHRAAYQAHLHELVAARASGAASVLWLHLRPIAIIVLLPGFLLGLAFPLANAMVQDASSEVGGRAGTLYLANTVGNVLGATVTGFVFLPALGVDTTLLAMLAAVMLSMVVIQLGRGAEGSPDTSSSRTVDASDYAIAAVFAVLAACIIATGVLRGDWLVRASLPSDQDGTRRVLHVSEGLNETIAVVEVGGVQRALFTNGHPMSATDGGAQRYMRAFVHIPLLMRPSPKAVLVICFGVGNTLHAASLHPSIDRLHVADLSRHVLEHARYFEATNHGVLRDPRVRVFVNDGRHHLLMQPEGAYDLITLEPPPITFAGVTALYSEDFYALARSRLTDGGFVTQWLPGYQTDADTVLSLVRSFTNVFPNAVLLSGFDKELILVGSTGSTQLDIDAVSRRLRDNERVRADLHTIALGTDLEIAGTLVASSRTLRAAAANVPAVTDDLPLLEYRHASPVLGTRLPPALFAVGDIDAWCPHCTRRIPMLGAYLGFLGAYYQTEAFLAHGGVGSPITSEQPPLPDGFAKHPYLLHLLEGDSFFAKQKARDHLAAGDVDSAISALMRGAYLNPHDVEIVELLGAAQLALGDTARAIAILSRAVVMAPKRGASHAAIAGAFRAHKDFDSAGAAARNAVALDPESAAAQYELAAILAIEGDLRGSDAALTTTLALDPTHAKANAVLCKRLVKRARPTEAKPHCQLAESGGVVLNQAIQSAIRQAGE